MKTDLPDPLVAVAAPAVLEPPAMIAAAPPWSRDRITDAINGVLFYGLLAFGVLFPVVATTYAVIVY